MGGSKRPDPADHPAEPAPTRWEVLLRYSRYRPSRHSARTDLPPGETRPHSVSLKVGVTTAGRGHCGRSRLRATLGGVHDRPRSMHARRTKRKLGKPLEIVAWDGPLSTYAASADYVGSPEHKDYVNPVLNEPPKPRTESDGSRCPEYPKEAWPRFTASLRAAIEAGCVAGSDAGGWPRYVWGWHDGRLFQARHRTDPPGNRYKGWWITSEERPKDLGGRLTALAQVLQGT